MIQILELAEKDFKINTISMLEGKNENVFNEMGKK